MNAARRFLALGLVGAVGTVLAGCGPAPDPVRDPAPRFASSTASGTTLLASSHAPSAGDAMPQALVSGELQVNDVGCVTIGGQILVAPYGSTIDADGVHLKGIGDFQIGDEVDPVGGGYVTLTGSVADHPDVARCRSLLAPEREWAGMNAVLGEPTGDAEGAGSAHESADGSIRLLTYVPEPDRPNWNARVSGTVEVNLAGCVTIGGIIANAPDSWSVLPDGSGIRIPGRPTVRFGEEIDGLGGGYGTIRPGASTSPESLACVTDVADGDAWVSINP